MISFRAKYISSVNIQKINPKNDKKEPCEASFVELDPLNLYDTDAIASASIRWGKPEYSELIANNMEMRKKYPEKYRFDTNKFYAITTQKKYFNVPEPSEILAVCKAEEDTDGVITVKALQVKPDKYIYKEPFYYNHVGMGILQSLKKLFSGKDIKLFSTPNAKPFYLANGFMENKECETEMYYEA